MVEQSYEVGQAKFSIRTTSQEFGKWMNYALGDYRTNAEAENWLSVVVGADPKRATRDFHILYWSNSCIVRTLHLPTVARGLLQQVESVLFKQRDDAIYLQAIPLFKNGTVGLAPGSLLTVIGKYSNRASRAGVKLPLTPNVPVDLGSGEILPTGPLLDIPGDVFDRLGELFPDKPDAPSDAHAEVQRPTKIDVVLSYAKTRGAVDLQPQSRSAALYDLASRASNLPVVGATGLDAIKQLLQRSTCYQITVGSAADTIKTVSSALNGHSDN